MIHLKFYVLVSMTSLVASLAPFHHYPATESSSNGNRVVQQRTSTYSPPMTTTGLRYTTNNPVDYCRGHADTYAAAEPGSKCRRYFRCNGAAGRPSIYLCPGKLVFNGQRCVHSSDYNCHHNNATSVEQPASLPVPAPIPSPVESKLETGPKDCDGRADGYYQDSESGCRSYFYCAGGLKATYVCPDKALFDGQRCVDSESYNCPYSSSDCLGASNGYHADLNSGCRNYYFCSGDGHKLITLTCSDGRLFDGKKCVDPSQYRCPSETKTSTHLESYYAYSAAARRPSGSQTYFIDNRAQQTTTSRPNNKSDYCEKSYGFFAVHGTGCRHYYLCIGGSRSDLQCSGDTVFNGQVCVDPSQYTCPELNPDCQGKIDGVYADRQSGCRNYFLCLGELQTNLSCPAGQLFDGRRCSDARRVTCTDSVEGRSTLTPCTGRTNGLYPDYNFPGCRGYLYCRAGRPYGPVGRCTRSERFSGPHSRCLPKHEVECRSSEDTNEDEDDYMMAESSALVTVVADEDSGQTTFTTAASTTTAN